MNKAKTCISFRRAAKKTGRFTPFYRMQHKPAENTRLQFSTKATKYWSKPGKDVFTYGRALLGTRTSTDSENVLYTTSRLRFRANTKSLALGICKVSPSKQSTRYLTGLPPIR